MALLILNKYQIISHPLFDLYNLMITMKAIYDVLIMTVCLILLIIFIYFDIVSVK